MKYFPITYFLFFITISYSQTKIVFTAIDYSNNEVRAAICDEDGTNRNDLGFNKTYLPVWFNNKILLNSDTFIWECDTSGANLKKLCPGYRVSVSNNKKMFAFYNEDGIGISNESGRIIKQISVNVFEDAAITWSKNDDKVSYFDPEKEKCFLFSLDIDSLEIFGDSIYHPLWNLKNDYCIYNRARSDGKYSIQLRNDITKSEIMINQENQNAVVPIWSNSGDKIAFLVFQVQIENNPDTDLFPCDLVLYDVAEKTVQLLSTQAGFTDRAYPQMCFDESDEFIYFTKINTIGFGSIARINLKTLVEETISKNNYVDERFPQVKTF